MKLCKALGYFFKTFKVPLLTITPMIKIKHLASTIVLCLFSLNAMAQIKGKVVDATDNSPVIGASVTVPKTSKGVTTDADGNFSLDVPVGTSIEVSFIGYNALKLKAENEVMLSASVMALDEVVVSVGSRNTKRTLTDTPVLIDIVSERDLISRGQTTFDKAAIPYSLV
ncbi:MAG: iron complex outermembrane receptor protein [Spirosomataceae bacterium]|jgi:iron complex outermembrane receptor protein